MSLAPATEGEGSAPVLSATLKMSVLINFCLAQSILEKDYLVVAYLHWRPDFVQWRRRGVVGDSTVLAASRISAAPFTALRRHSSGGGRIGAVWHHAVAVGVVLRRGVSWAGQLAVQYTAFEVVNIGINVGDVYCSC
jgi:hypothetical protein